MRSLLGRVILVVGFSPSALYICPATPFWLAEFLLKDQLLTLWGFPCVLFVAFPLYVISCFSLVACNIFVELGGVLWTNVLNLALPPQKHRSDAWLEHQGPVIHTAQNKREKKKKERKKKIK